MTAKSRTYQIPTTGAQIVADTAASYAALPELAFLAPQIAKGTAVIRVNAQSDERTGRHMRASVWAGVVIDDGSFVAVAYDADDTDVLMPVVTWQSKDGRVSPGPQAKRVLARFFAMEDATEISYHDYKTASIFDRVAPTAAPQPEPENAAHAAGYLF